MNNAKIDAVPVVGEDHEIAKEIVQSTMRLVAEVGFSHEDARMGIALAIGAIAQGLLISMIAAGKPGTTGDRAIAMLIEQLQLNKEKAEIAAALIQKQTGLGGGMLQ